MLVCVVAFGLQGVINLKCVSDVFESVWVGGCVCRFTVLAMLVDSSIPLTSVL